MHFRTIKECKMPRFLSIFHQDTNSIVEKMVKISIFKVMIQISPTFGENVVSQY
jgi:hypothetical protein